MSKKKIWGTFKVKRKARTNISVKRVGMIKGVAESTGTSNEMGNVGSEKECTHICKTGCQAVLSQIKLAKSRARSINLAGIHLEKSQ